MRRKGELRYKGAIIAIVSTPRFEVRHVDGRKVRSFASLSSAKAFVDGYAKAVDAYAPKERKA